VFIKVVARRKTRKPIEIITDVNINVSRLQATPTLIKETNSRHAGLMMDLHRPCAVRASHFNTHAEACLRE